MEGVTIGQYRLVRKIGAGGMGTVYLAEHTLVGRPAAVKVLLAEWSARRDIVTRFFNEARAMSSIPDPGIVQMFDFGFHSDGCAYIVMELLEGETLSARRKRLGRLAATDALRLIRQIAGTLVSAHERGVIHRDLKPDNIFIVRDLEALGGERPKLLDFGIAKLADQPDSSYTLPGQVLGTPVYMSPEQCRGAGEIDNRTDIYSLGCVLYSLVAGRPPFKLVGVGELISAHMNTMPEPPSAHVDDLPEGLDEIVMRCLAKAPGDRYQSMRELQEACESCRTLSTATAQPTTLGAAAGEQSTPPSRSRRAFVIAGAAIVTIAIGGALAIGFGSEEEVPVAATTAPVQPPAAPATAPVTVTAPEIDASVAAIPDAGVEVTATRKATKPPQRKKKAAPASKGSAEAPIDLYEGR